MAGRFATLPSHRPENKGPKSATSSSTVNDAALMLNVGKNAVKDARTVLTKAKPEIIAKVDRGEVSETDVL